jgi:cytidine deaminase
MTKLSLELKNKLWSAAEAASTQAYAPYSAFHVGAALLTTEGEIVSGCNVENSSYGLTNCAERTAVFRAIAEGKLAKGVSIAALAVVNREHQGCSPCGACRQVLAEFGPSATVLFEYDGERHETPISALLPSSFLL